jgi:GR25 family glycosyltransferase involved in LPS biosynthesis
VFRAHRLIVINLARQGEKRKFIERQFQRLGITDYEFFPAIDAKSDSFRERKAALRYDAHLAMTYEGRFLSDAIIAATATHFAIYEEMLRRECGRAIVLEDDAVFVNEYTHALNLDAIPADWDVCLLEAWLRRKPPTGRVAGDFYGLDSYRGGAAAYLINATGAEKLLAMRSPLIHPVDGNFVWHNIHARAGELMFTDRSQSLLNAYVRYPCPVINGSLAGYWSTSNDELWVRY